MVTSSPSTPLRTQKIIDAYPISPKSKPPLSPTRPTGRCVNMSLTNSLVWSPAASQSRTIRDVEDHFWLVENDDDWNAKKASTKGCYPASLMMPTKANEDCQTSKSCPLRPRAERDDSGLSGLAFLEDEDQQ